MITFGVTNRTKNLATNGNKAPLAWTSQSFALSLNGKTKAPASEHARISTISRNLRLGFVKFVANTAYPLKVAESLRKINSRELSKRLERGFFSLEQPQDECCNTTEREIKMIARHFVSAMMLLMLAPSFSSAQQLVLDRVANGLANPIFVTHAPGDANRLFIVQRSGAIRILDLSNPGSAPTTFMTVPGVDTFFEGGLLGLAFHPNYQSNGFFYVHYTSSSGGPFRNRIVRFTRTTPDTASSATLQPILDITQPQGNHNGGWIGFSPNDGFLYIAIGDGGNGNDSGSGHTPGIGNSQDITNNLLGKMLRIDIDGDDFPGDASRNYAIPANNPFVGATGDDEIFLYGLRNPFRCSFDRANGDLYIGDVGQGAREEISYYPASGNPDRNMGWRLREGAIQTPGVGGSQPTDGVNPIYDYPRTGQFGGNSVTGGVVYRGPIAALNGTYFFGDFGSNGLWCFRYDGSAPADFDGDNTTPVLRVNNFLTVNQGTLGNMVAFGEDLAGNVYIVDLFGEVFRIADGFIAIAGDVNLDGLVNLLDVADFVNAISNGIYSYEADTNMDGRVNLLDVSSFIDILAGT